MFGLNCGCGSSWCRCCLTETVLPGNQNIKIIKYKFKVECVLKQAKVDMWPISREWINWRSEGIKW